MSLVEFAKNELQKLIDDGNLKEEDLEMQKVINNNILDIINVFKNQAHSGLTASYCINILDRLLRYKPLTPLTGKDDEWESNPFDESILQNKRCPSVFKDRDSGNAYDVEAKIFSDDNGKSWYTSKDSKLNIVFPYVVPAVPESIIKNESEK